MFKSLMGWSRGTSESLLPRHGRSSNGFAAPWLVLALVFLGAETFAESPGIFRSPLNLPIPHSLDLGTFEFDIDPVAGSLADTNFRRLQRKLGVFHAAGEEGVSGGGSSAEADLEMMANKANNPLSDVWLLIVENDTTLIGGNEVSGSETLNVTLIEPVLPVPVFDNEYNLIFRPILPIISSPLDKDVGKLFGRSDAEIAGSPKLSKIAADPYGERSAGLGDLIVLTLFGPNADDGFVYGAGVSTVFPTATEDVLGAQKWQIGPAALAVRLGTDHGGLGIENWNIGFLAQQWFSYAGTGDREAVNRMNLQYFINWKMNATQLIGMTPNIVIDWEEKDIDDAVSLPIGLGTIGMMKIGKLPIRWGVEVQYYVVQPDDAGPRVNFKVFFAPIILNPFK